MLLASARRVRSRTPPHADDTFRSQAPPTFDFGDQVRVLHSFSHAVGHHFDIVAGLHGVVTEVDSQGDALIQFQGMSMRKWICGDEKALLEVVHASGLKAPGICGVRPKAKPHAPLPAPPQRAPQSMTVSWPRWNVLDNRPRMSKPSGNAGPEPHTLLGGSAFAKEPIPSGGLGSMTTQSPSGINLAAVMICDPDQLHAAVRDVSAQIAAVPGTANTSVSVTFHPPTLTTLAAFHARFRDMGIVIEEMTRAGVPTKPHRYPWAAMAGDSFQPCLLVCFSPAPKEQKVSFQCRLKRAIVTAKGKRAAISANLETMIAFLGKPSSVVASNAPPSNNISGGAPVSIVEMLRRSQGQGS